MNHQHINYILCFHSTISKVIFFITPLIGMFFLIAFINVIFGIPLPFFLPSIWINSLFLIGTLVAFLHT